MIILRQKEYGKKKDNHTAEIATGLAGIGGTAALGIHEYKHNIKPHKDALKILDRRIDSAKDIIGEINNEIRQKGGYDAIHYDRVRNPINPLPDYGGKYQTKNKQYYGATYSPDSGMGQLERAEDSMARYDSIKSRTKRSARNNKEAEHVLDKAEKRAKKALEYFEKDKKFHSELKKSGIKRAGIIGASGLALTAGTVAGVKAYKKHKKDKEK